MSVKINDVDIYETYGMILLSREIPKAEVKKVEVDIQGMNGTLDLTEALTGEVTYRNRLMKLSFGVTRTNIQKWHSLYSQFSNNFHGKVVKIVFDADNKYFWTGRLEVGSQKGVGHTATFDVEVSVKPFKYSIYSSAEQWLWDPFNFLTDYANQLMELTVNGTLVTTVLGSVVPTNPIISSNTAMKVEFEGEIYDVKEGSYTYYTINLKNGENALTFMGDGVVTIDVRGGSL